MGQTNIFTYTLTGASLTLSKVDNAVSCSVLVTAGSVSFLGTLVFAGLSSNAVNWGAGQGITLMGTISNPLDGITITAPSGSDSAEIIITYS